MLSAIAMPLLLLLAGRSASVVVAALLIAALICFKHKDNLQRLIRGEERRWKRRMIMSNAQEGDPIPHQNRNR